MMGNYHVRFLEGKGAVRHPLIKREPYVDRLIFFVITH